MVQMNCRQRGNTQRWFYIIFAPMPCVNGYFCIEMARQDPYVPLGPLISSLMVYEAMCCTMKNFWPCLFCCIFPRNSHRLFLFSPLPVILQDFCLYHILPLVRIYWYNFSLRRPAFLPFVNSVISTIFPERFVRNSTKYSVAMWNLFHYYI